MSIEYTLGSSDAARNTPTALWNDSSDPSELAQSISFGGVGATCNPTIAYTCINQRRDVWLPHRRALAKEMPEATESEIGWQVVRELSPRPPSSRAHFRGRRMAATVAYPCRRIRAWPVRQGPR